MRHTSTFVLDKDRTQESIDYLERISGRPMNLSNPLVKDLVIAVALAKGGEASNTGYLVEKLPKSIWAVKEYTVYRGEGTLTEKLSKLFETSITVSSKESTKVQHDLLMEQFAMDVCWRIYDSANRRGLASCARHYQNVAVSLILRQDFWKGIIVDWA